MTTMTKKQPVTAQAAPDLSELSSVAGRLRAVLVALEMARQPGHLVDPDDPEEDLGYALGSELFPLAIRISHELEMSLEQAAREDFARRPAPTAAPGAA